MAFGLKVLLSITAPLLVVVAPSIAADFTYKEYAKESDIWKRGFVFSISQHMSAMPQPDEEAPPLRNAFERCLASSTDAVLVRHVEAYVARNRVNSNEPMVRVVMRTLFDLCRSEIEKTKSPRTAPRPVAK
jgi:hypothetical protein